MRILDLLSLATLSACAGSASDGAIDVLPPEPGLFGTGGPDACDAPLSESPWASSDWASLTRACTWSAICPEGAHAAAVAAIDEDETTDEVYVGADGRVVAHRDPNDVALGVCDGESRSSRWFGPIVDDCPVTA